MHFIVSFFTTVMVGTMSGNHISNYCLQINGKHSEFNSFNKMSETSDPY